MKNFDRIEEEVSQRLSSKRFEHSKQVAKTAAELALKWGCDPDQAYLAGLLHDVAREMPLAMQVELLKYEGIDLLPEEEKTSALLHASVSAIVTREDFGIDNPEILEAIVQHTIGGTNMSPLGCILYLADAIEPGRDYRGVEKIRKLAYQDLDQALLAAYDNTIGYLKDHQCWIHPVTLIGREELAKSIAERR